MLKYLIPHAFTTGNLVAGVLGLYFLHMLQWETAWYFLLVGVFCDFLDGFFARILKAESLFGKELDSLADVVSFGLLPGFMIVFYFKDVFFLHDQLVVGGLYVIMAAFRLAKFNTQKNSYDYFVGLPSPAAAIFVFSSLLFWSDVFSKQWLLIFQFLISWAMIVPVHLENLKMKAITSKFLFITLVIIGSSFAVILNYKSIAIIVLMYYVLGMVLFQFKKKVIV
ncbi:MAG: CDP-diacylglycerol--serine O-phosphatidyltransferase [Bacteroidales bacterium]|nr:CDP-diacylglycerol--serine O-phosphatidyltransferase [Bacteroidales bacterium]